MKEDTKQLIRDLRQSLELYKHYAWNYGNASRECDYGYPQQRGLICGLCGHDNSYDGPCPKLAAAKGE
jgi:hypothetical protein